MLSNFHADFFFKINFFKNSFSNTIRVSKLSECLTVWIQIRTDFLLVFHNKFNKFNYTKAQMLDYIYHLHVQIQKGGQGVWTPPLHPKNHKNIGFLSNSGPDPLKITKLPSQHSMLGHHQNASETPFKCVSLAS